MQKETLGSMTIKEAAERLGFSFKHIRRIVVEHGIGLHLGNRRRLLEADFEALKEILRAKPLPTRVLGARPATTAYKGNIFRDPLAEALELAAQAKPRKKRRRWDHLARRGVTGSNP